MRYMEPVANAASAAAEQCLATAIAIILNCVSTAAISSSAIIHIAMDRPTLVKYLKHWVFRLHKL